MAEKRDYTSQHKVEALPNIAKLKFMNICLFEVAKLSRCFPENVFVAYNSVDVIYGELSMLMAELVCIEELLRSVNATRQKTPSMKPKNLALISSIFSHQLQEADEDLNN